MSFGKQSHRSTHNQMLLSSITHLMPQGISLRFVVPSISFSSLYTPNDHTHM
jgi:hypothetical protein